MFVLPLLVIVSLTANLSLVAAAARSLTCLNATHWQRCSTGPGGPLCEVGGCRFGFACAGASCRGANLSDHLPRGADFQLVLSVPASQLAECTSHGADVAAGRMLCDVWHATAAARPTFGHILGNTWLHFGFGPGAGAPPCNANASAWRACVGANTAAIVAALQAESPELLLSGGLMEFLDAANLDDAADFPAAVCVPGTVGQWGGNTTCVPDVTRPAAQAYYVAWGRAFLDAGIRAVFFGQARLTGGGAPGGGDDVDPRGAAGFAAVISSLRDYAATRGLGDVYFGPQAAAGITLANGTNVADWAYGAQHLEAHGGFLTQPTLKNGSFIAAAAAQYGAGDLHDVSRANAGGGGGGPLPTALDYDNYSGDEGVYDDIRRLTAVADGGARAALVTNHYRYVRAYSRGGGGGGGGGGGAAPQSFAAVTIPFSKWLAVPSECACYANMSVPLWGAGPIYFSAYACGLLDVAAALWADPDAGTLDGGVAPAHLGQQLQGAGDAVVHAFAAALNRSVGGRAEFEAAVAALPPRMYAARGARRDLVVALLTGAEFNATMCPPALGVLPRARCCVSAAHRAVLLSAAGEGDLAVLAPALAAGELTVAGVVDVFVAEADAAGLYRETL